MVGKNVIYRKYDDYDDKNFSSFDVDKNQKNQKISLGTINYAISGHRICWKYKLQGIPKIRPDRIINMKGWVCRIWHIGHATIKTTNRSLIIYIRYRKCKGTEKVLNRSFIKQLRIVKDFCEWQKVAVEVSNSPHHAKAQSAHLVFESKGMIGYLGSEIDKPTSSEIGLTTDGSHRGKPEMEGPQAIEGGMGADWVFLQMPREFQDLKAQVMIQEQTHRRQEEEHKQIATAITLILKSINSKNDIEQKGNR